MGRYDKCELGDVTISLQSGVGAPKMDGAGEVIACAVAITFSPLPGHLQGPDVSVSFSIPPMPGANFLAVERAALDGAIELLGRLAGLDSEALLAIRAAATADALKPFDPPTF